MAKLEELWNENNPLVVVGPQYVSHERLYLKLKRNPVKLSTGNFSVFSDYKMQNKVFEIKGKVRSLRKKKTLFTPSGEPIVTICHKLPTVHQRWQCYRGTKCKQDDELLFTTKYPSFSNHFKKVEIQVYLTANTKESACDFKIKGNCTGTSCAIYVGDTDISIAEIDRKVDTWSVIGNQDIYWLTVAPHIDQAFVLALLLALDETKHVEKCKI